MRLLNRPLAFLLAVALAATGVIVIIEVIAYAVHAKSVVVPWRTWQHWAQRTHWNRAVIKVWSVVLLIVGLLLVLSQLKRRRVTRMAMQTQDDHTDTAMTRKGLAGTVRTAVLDVEGISEVDTHAKRHSVRVVATASGRDPESAQALADPVHEAAQRGVDALRLKKSMRIRATVKNTRS